MLPKDHRSSLLPVEPFGLKLDAGKGSQLVDSVGFGTQLHNLVRAGEVGSDQRETVKPANHQVLNPVGIE